MTPIESYANLMEEAKLRFQSIELVTSGKAGLHPMIAQEVGYLQLRLLCEIVALGCLIAHGDITGLEINQLIIKILSKLLPNFYPRPVVISGPNPGETRMESKASGFLTKQELLTLYGKTGNYLHRGELKKMESRPPYTKVDFSDIVQWTNKFIVLLEAHHIASGDNNKHWICALNHPDDGGRVRVAFAQAPQPPQ